MSLILNNKSPTWEVLQKNNFHCLSWCSLHKKTNETIENLTMLCSFTKDVWKEVEGMT